MSIKHTLYGYEGKEYCYGRRLEHYPPDVQKIVEQAKSFNPELRVKAAGNPDLPEKYIRHLATDNFAKVCIALAGNPNTPSDVLDKLRHIQLTPMQEQHLPLEFMRFDPIREYDSEQERKLLKKHLLSNIEKNPNATEDIRKAVLADLKEV